MNGDRTEKPLVLVTGSSGLIGTAIIKALAPDYRIVGLDIKPMEEEIEGATWIECDLTDDQGVADSLKAVRDEHGDHIASVVHLAAYYDFSGEPSPLYEELTVQGTRRLLRTLEDFQVEQFIFSSSLLAMKPVEPGEYITESSPTQAEWEYPQSKLDAEAVIEHDHGDIPAVILRLAGVYNDNCRSLPIAQQIKRIYEEQFESYFFPGNSEHGQSFVHLEDAVNAFKQAVQRRDSLEPYEVFVIGEKDLVSYGELQDKIGELIHGKRWPTIRVPKPVAKAGAWVQEKVAGEEETFIKPWMVDLADAHYPVSPELAERKLGWKPQHSLRETIEPMIERLKRDPEGWYEENGLSQPEKSKG